MNTWIVLFRGINVGGKNILPMRELAELLAKNRYTNVRTYIQSGNVVLQSRKAKALAIAEHIGDLVLDSHGFRPGVIVLSKSDLERAVVSNPFPKAEEDPKALHLYFLAQPPMRPNLAALNDLRSTTESFELRKDILYLHAPDGIARSKLATRAERLLGVEATGRNWRTVGKLLELGNQLG